jgi:hypothetical protein
VEQHFTGPGVEMNSAPADSAQVGRGHSEAFFCQYLHRRLAILSAHCRPIGIYPADRENVGAAEEFDLHFIPASPEGVSI